MQEKEAELKEHILLALEEKRSSFNLVRIRYTGHAQPVFIWSSVDAFCHKSSYIVIFI